MSVGSKFAEKLLVGAVESIARAGAKFVESLASDTKKALAREAKRAELVEQGVKFWSQVRLGEIEDVDSNSKKENGVRS
jgi:hypothetical protein